jgi:hypothetical protein
MVDEMTKIANMATVSAPSIKAPPAPGGLTGQLNSNPQGPVPPAKIISKGLRSTNLQKTDYSSVNSTPPTPNVTLTSAQKALPPPVVR